MGFINSANTTTLRLKLTDEGREQILNGGNLIDLFKTFSLSDGDIDYRSTKKHSDTSAILNDSDQLGFIPDITGNESTFRNSVNVGYSGKDHIWAQPEETNVSEIPNKFVSVGITGTDGTTRYYRDDVTIDVYLHDYFVLNKLLMSRYIDDHKNMLSSGSTSTIESDMSAYFKTALGVTSNGDYSMMLDKLSEYGIGQYLDFWDGIKVYDGNTLNTESVNLVSYTDSDYYNSIALAGGAFMMAGQRGEHTGIEFEGTNIKGLKIASPFSMLFSPDYNKKNNRHKPGAGNASIGFGAFDMGYLNVGGVSSWDNNVDSYPKFIMSNTTNGWSTNISDIKNVFVGFVSTVDMETKDIDFKDTGYDNITTTIPTSRIVVDVSAGDSSPKYYPIKLKRLSKTTDKIIDIGLGVKGIQITDTNHPTDTYGLLSGSLEYVSDWNSTQKGFKSSAPYFNILPSKDGGTTTPNKVLNKTEPYYTLGSRMMDMSDNIFVSLASQKSEYWKTDVYSGGFRAGLSGASRGLYNISIPIKWGIYSNESTDASPVNVTVNFKFNKGAVLESVLFDNTLSQDYYRVYDNPTFKFYGEDGETLSSYSTDPRGHNYISSDTYSWRTSNNKQLFRKLISGQEIKHR